MPGPLFIALIWLAFVVLVLIFNYGAHRKPAPRMPNQPRDVAAWREGEERGY